LLQGDFVLDTLAFSKILASPDGRFVFSAGADGSIFIYSVTEYANETTFVF
jgi:WD40 repeat protein